MPSGVPPLILLELHFRTLAPIHNLPHYHGPKWSALFRELYKTIPGGNSDHENLIWVHPIETGVTSYRQGEPLNIGLTFHSQHLKLISALLDNFNTTQTTRGHFQPGKTVLFEKALCRMTGDTWDPSNPAVLSDDILQDECDRLLSIDSFSLLFHSPLRLTRQGGAKTEGHRYCDEDYFLSSPEPVFPIRHFADKIRLLPQDTIRAQEDVLKITGGGLTWLDVSYGEAVVKTFGGVVGKLGIEGRMNAETARRLIIGQYTGCGKNPAFGFGFYAIPELDSVRKIKPLERGMSLLERSLTVGSLSDSLKKLPRSSPGPDNLTVTDLQKAGDTFLAKIGKEVRQGSYRHGPFRKYHMHKDDGTFREIHVQNTTDRLLQRTIADVLSAAVERLLSGSSYAYRRGLSRKGAASALKKAMGQGYTTGFKADISSFFDSVKTGTLCAFMEGLFPSEPLVREIRLYLMFAADSGIRGLPQGSPLSPLLSNLYLTSFDREMQKEGFRLVRYSDDFVVLFNKDNCHEECLKKIEESLLKLGLKLKASKLKKIEKELPVEFLGYLISANEISDVHKELEQKEEEWNPVFREEWLSGVPVYLTSICRGAYSSGPSLVIKTDEDETVDIPWSSVGRVVVVGRSPFSGGVVYRSVKEDIPVTFIDVMGRSRGHLYPEHYEMQDIRGLQKKYAEDNALCLEFAKEIISTKIHNSYVLLRRNSISSDELKQLSYQARDAKDMDMLRGYEGAAARIYWGEFAGLVKPFEFRGRVFHPPDGPVNVMLSLGYSLLYNRLASVLYDKGFNPREGLMHKGRGTHAALSSDLVEELRHIVERVVLALIHKGEMNEADFNCVQNGEASVTRLCGEGFRKYIHRFEFTMATKASYNGSERMSYNAYLDEMSENLKRSIRLGSQYKALRID